LEIKMTIEAMKQALEALEKMYAEGFEGTCGDAITSLRQAIAEAEKQEPMAKVVAHGATVKLEWHSVDAAHNAKEGNLYTHAQPSKPLTDEQIMNALKLKSCDGYRAIVRAIEAAHGIKE
jgi:hypothetical protein